MAAELKVEVVTPTGRVLEVDAEIVSAPGVYGEFAVLPEHRPAVVLLTGGVIRYRGRDGEGTVFVRGGVAEVTAEGVLVLADEARLPEQVDAEVAEALRVACEAELGSDVFLDDDRDARVLADRRFAEAMLAAAGR